MRSLAVVAVLLVATAARADDIAPYEADGEADSTSKDARVTALDDAFARAIATALGDIVSADVRTAKRADLDREIIGHARLWVAKFSVTRDATSDGRRQLTVSVRVDRDKMRARLTELGISAAASQAKPAARPVAILLRVTTPAGVAASYGPPGDKAQGLAALDAALHQSGMGGVRLASSPPVKPSAEWPLEDDEAASVADAAHAELAAVASVEVGAAVSVRGQAAPASLVTARIRLIDVRERKLIAAGATTTATRGDSPAALGQAIDGALVAALADVVPPAPVKLDTPTSCA